MTLDLTLLSFSKTAMEVIQAITRVTRAITVILFIVKAYPRKMKQATAITSTVIRYFKRPPLLKISGMSSAAQITPRRRHLKISINNSSIKFTLSFIIITIIFDFRSNFNYNKMDNGNFFVPVKYGGKSWHSYTIDTAQ